MAGSGDYHSTDVFGDDKKGCCSKFCSGMGTCIRSVPFGSIVAVSMALVGFGLSIKGWHNTATALESAGLDIGSVQGYVGYALGATLALDVCILVFAFCATGRTREKCMGGEGGGKKCGRCMIRFINALFAFIVYLAVAWNLVLILITAVLIVLEFVFNEMCGEAANIGADFAFEVHRFGLSFNIQGVAELKHFCEEVHPITNDMVMMFGGAIVSMFAQVNMLINVCVNFVRIGYESRNVGAGQTHSKLSMALVGDEYP